MVYILHICHFVHSVTKNTHVYALPNRTFIADKRSLTISTMPLLLESERAAGEGGLQC